MRLADYIVARLYEKGVKDIFFVPGYGNMHLVDALARSAAINAVSVHHEQAAAMAALSYAKYNHDFGACFVTTGCGGANAVTGVLHAWQDSVPCLIVSGQIDTPHMAASFDVKLRQVGKQEANIVAIVKSITKYALTVTDPKSIAYHLDRAIHEAKSGRPGPVWLDIPMDVQSANVEPENLERFQPGPAAAGPDLSTAARSLLADLQKAQRPIVLAGGGVRMSGALKAFQTFVHKGRLPVVMTKAAPDVLDSDDELSIGVAGSQSGSRAGNFALANSDLLLTLGSRLSVNVTGYDYKSFARAAKVVVIDIDAEEHAKNTVRIDSFVQADLKKFLEVMNELEPPPAKTGWLEKCRHWKEIFPFLTEEEKEGETIDLFEFNRKMSEALKDDTVIVSDTGNVCFTLPASVKIERGLRSITSAAQAEMGYALPGAIGVCYARGLKEVVCAIGDGSIMMNIQELATVAFRQLPIKIFVINNDGYACIRSMQSEAYRGRTLGTDASNGLGFPSFQKVADCFGLKYARIAARRELEAKLNEVVNLDGPVLCEVMTKRVQKNFLVALGKNSRGRLAFRPLEDLSPFLDRDVFLKEMIIPPLD
ncbi:MAG: thiamine pyrophosphate-binding protein [Candidatus Adiutrix sp.]|jgi:acetolactate synthase-1/2/3 large subunit|nr:thiamine pyrophosphate-binding protein [Candidatus Adiutrix sp.]